MILIKDHKIIVEVEGDPKEYLENLREAMFHLLKHQSMYPPDVPDPDGQSVFVLEFLQEEVKDEAEGN